MRKLIYSLSFILLLIASGSFGQNIGNLDGIYYQAVALDDDPQEIVGVDVEAKPLYNREIGVRFTITSGLDGDIQWQEEHVTTTDKYGLFTLTIGQGNVTSTAYATMLDMPWIDADQFLKVEIATKNDGDYTTVGNQKFMTVPYAFYTDDIADDAITTAKILNEEVLSEDIKNETILADDINTGAVETSEILDETIIADDIATSAVESDEILDETIVADDIAEGAVTTSEILDETIAAADIATGAVASDEILDETIVASDIATGAVETSEILDASILNEDIANNTIDLNAKVANVGPKQILIGDTTATASPKMKTLVGTGGISIFQSADSVFIQSTLGSGGVESNGNLSANIGTVNSGAVWGPSQTYNVTLTNGQGASVGDLVLASLDQPLDGCILSAWIHGIQGDKVQIKFSIFNPTGNNVTFGNGVNVKLLIVN